MRFPAVGIVGRSGAGKTTLIEGLLRELTGRGYAVATLKHTHHRLELDRPGSDTDRHLGAGAACAWLSGPGGVSSRERPPLELDLAGCLARACHGVDLILVEGFKTAQLPRIEVVRSSISREPMVARDRLWMVASDCPVEGVELFDLEDHAGIADRIEDAFLGRDWTLEVLGGALPARELRTVRNLLLLAGITGPVRFSPGPAAGALPRAEEPPAPDRPPRHGLGHQAPPPHPDSDGAAPPAPAPPG
ncbi:MAG: molybdopterin-guanine dinucleotide biosynthesis protein B [Armatimonadetes bacterium]|nr:molybdopterin-guanine dinucleotide biosynthesis protein B [Armatimonadota bacterium]